MQVNIQWYPGHMAKTKRELEENLAIVDMVLEVRDARIPVSSHNADLAKLVAKRPVVTILAKADLAESELTAAWVRSLENQGIPTVAMNLKSGHGLAELEKKIRALHRQVRERLQQRGRQSRSLRGMVIGVPNVGKSTLINRLAKRAVTKTGARPGVTRGKQWVRIGDWLQLLDIPGGLWPKFEDPATGFHLAVTGAISEDVFDYVKVGSLLAEILATDRPKALEHRFGLKTMPTEAGAAILEAIGRRRGLLLPGGHVDEEKAALLLLREFRQGLLGNFTWNIPPDF